jgi:hypothetical protein
LKVGPQQLEGNAKMALLSDPVAMARLHAAVWECGSGVMPQGIQDLSRLKPLPQAFSVYCGRGFSLDVFDLETRC